MTVDEAGAWVHHTYVDYSVGDREYTLVIGWDNISCGDQISKDWCPKRRSYGHR